MTQCRKDEKVYFGKIDFKKKEIDEFCWQNKNITLK